MLLHPLKNNHGVALIFMVLLFAAAATASIIFISLGVKVKNIQREGVTQQRLAKIRTALQNYYLIHYDLPDPSLTTPPGSVPATLLNLSQKYRFDINGQMIHYDRQPANGHMTTVRNIQVHGLNAENSVAAVLIAPGPNKRFDSTLTSPYDVSANPVGDDLVLAISLEAEALKIANHTVAVLQQAAKAYDSIFYGINNDLDTLYYPAEETRWVDLTQPTNVRSWQQTGIDGSGNPVFGWVNTGAIHNNYSGDNFTTYNADGSTTITVIGQGDEYVEPVPQDAPYFPPQPESIIDEDGYIPAEGGTGSGCIRIAAVDSGQILTNDPDRGTASLDVCSSSTPAYGLAVAYGLNLAKLGLSGNSLLDPWGNPYLWGAAQNFPPFTHDSTEAQDLIRDRHYWTFYSTGPDGINDTSDDILPPADRIPGYWQTPPITNPIP